MANSILVRPKELRTSAKEIADHAKRIQGAISIVSDLVSGLSVEKYAGSRATALRFSFRNKQDVLNSMTGKMQKFSSMLYTIASQMETADERLGNGLNPILENELFKRGEKDNSPIHPSDITQGSTGDCYLLASLAAIAIDNPELIQDMITINEDGSYTVRFFNETSKEFEYINIEKEDIPNSWRTAGVGDDGELWVQVVERAYAEWIDQRNIRDPGWSRLLEMIGFEGKNDYKLINGGYPHIAMEQMTGKPSDVYVPATEMTIEELQYNLEAGNPVTIGTHQKPIKGNRLYDNKMVVTGHAYYIHSYNAEAGTVELRNPWGWNHDQGLLVVPASELLESVTHVAVNKIAS